MRPEFPPKGGISDCDLSPVNSRPMNYTGILVDGL